MPLYVAFLRGINSGQNPTIKMETLAGVFTGLGHRNVKTVLASGNVIFESDRTDKNALAEDLERTLTNVLGYRAAASLRTKEEIEEMVRAEPFKDIEITTQTRLYVTFLKPDGRFEFNLPYRNQEKGFAILNARDGAIYSVVDLAKGMTPDLMGDLDKKFGREITTRNWNTVLKILVAMHSKAV